MKKVEKSIFFILVCLFVSNERKNEDRNLKKSHFENKKFAKVYNVIFLMI